MLIYSTGGDRERERRVEIEKEKKRGRKIKKKGRESGRNEQNKRDGADAWQERETKLIKR